VTVTAVALREANTWLAAHSDPVHFGIGMRLQRGKNCEITKLFANLLKSDLECDDAVPKLLKECVHLTTGRKNIARIVGVFAGLMINKKVSIQPARNGITAILTLLNIERRLWTAVERCKYSGISLLKIRPPNLREEYETALGRDFNRNGPIDETLGGTSRSLIDPEYLNSDIMRGNTSHLATNIRREYQRQKILRVFLRELSSWLAIVSEIKELDPENKLRISEMFPYVGKAALYDPDEFALPQILFPHEKPFRKYQKASRDQNSDALLVYEYAFKVIFPEDGEKPSSSSYRTPEEFATLADYTNLETELGEITDGFDDLEWT